MFIWYRLIIIVIIFYGENEDWAFLLIVNLITIKLILLFLWTDKQSFQSSDHSKYFTVLATQVHTFSEGCHASCQLHIRSNWEQSARGSWDLNQWLSDHSATRSTPCAIASQAGEGGNGGGEIFGGRIESTLELWFCTTFPITRFNQESNGFVMKTVNTTHWRYGLLPAENMKQWWMVQEEWKDSNYSPSDHPSDDCVTMDTGGDLVTKCIINLLCLRKTSVILAITAGSCPHWAPPAQGQQVYVSYILHSMSLMKHVNAWHKENKNCSVSKLRFTQLISDFICAVQVSFKGLGSPEENLCWAGWEPKPFA